MEAKEKAGVSRRWRTIALVAIGVALGTTMTATPVYSHVGKGFHYLRTHVLPATDKRYFKKRQSDVRYVNVGEKASISAQADNATNADNADALDGVDSTAFLRSTGKAADADKLDGMDSGVFVTGTTPAGGDLTGTYPNPSVAPDAISGAEIYEAGLGPVPTAANAERLGGNAPAAFMRMTTKWKSVSTIGERYPIELGNPACSADRRCYAQLRCDPGDVLLSGGYNLVDPGTDVITARPFNANGYDHKYTMVWENNSTVDEIDLNVLCADQ